MKVQKKWGAVLLGIVMLAGLCPGIGFAKEQETVSEEQTTEAVEEATEQTEDTVLEQTEEDAVTEAEEEVQTISLTASSCYISYSGHQENVGDLSAVADGEQLGQIGESLRMEALTVTKGEKIQSVSGEIYYRVHVQNLGTQDWRTSGELAGTTGEAKRLEGLQMYLTGDLEAQYDIYYRVHIQNFGWMEWVKGSQDDSGWAGTSGFSLRMEAVQIQLVAKGSTAPSGGDYSRGYLSSTDIKDVSYAVHQQNYGDLEAVSNGASAGMIGEALRLEALTINLTDGGENPLSGSISYRSHVQNVGWQDWVSEGELTGTTGKSLRMEAVQIQLTGALAKHFTVWYRVHVENYGWLGWAKNGQSAGTAGKSLRIESIEIKILPCWYDAPGRTNWSYLDDDTVYSVWIDAGHGGSDSGATNGSRYEKNDTLTMALEVQRVLKEQGAYVYMSRTDDDSSYSGTTSLMKRVTNANSKEADLFVSIHRDSASSSARGITIYTHNSDNDKIASRVNTTEWANKDEDCVTLSNNIYNQLMSVGAFTGRGVRYGCASGDTTQDLIVNRYTNMPSCLIELGFISNSADNIVYDAYLQANAKAIAKGIMATMGVTFDESLYTSD